MNDDDQLIEAMARALASRYPDTFGGSYAMPREVAAVALDAALATSLLVPRSQLEQERAEEEPLPTYGMGYADAERSFQPQLAEWRKALSWALGLGSAFPLKGADLEELENAQALLRLVERPSASQRVQVGWTPESEPVFVERPVAEEGS